MSFSSLPSAVWRLMVAYALMMAGTSMMVLLAGIIGIKLAPSADAATLPIAAAVIGVASSTLPTGRLLGILGRRFVFLGYGLLAIFGAWLAVTALFIESFLLFCAAAFTIGWSAAAGHQYRFAALESVPPERAASASSVLLFGGILAAFIGPEMAVAGQHLLSREFAGSFALLSLSYVAGMLLLSGYHDDRTGSIPSKGEGRALRQIFSHPIVVIAVSSAAVSYAIMSFIMTATPLSMHDHSGHSLQATKLVIQSHIAGMYLPSLIYPWLQSRLGYQGMIWIGVAVNSLCILVALIDTEFLHYWLALTLLGVGWNFLFLCGTNLLSLGYRPEERFRVQSSNDFIVFSVQAIVSLSAGWMLHQAGWNGLLLACLPILAVFTVIVWIFRGSLEQEQEA